MTDPTRISRGEHRRLAAEIARLHSELENVKQGLRATQLGNSSIEDGALLVRDGDGNVRTIVGRQVDGKFGWGAVNGAAPPRPNTPTVEGSTGGITVSWNGAFGGPAPSDFTYVRVYLSPAGESFIPSDGNTVGHLLGAGALPVAPLAPDTDYWAVLIAYNTSGVASEPSLVGGPAQTAPVVATEILDGIVTTLKLADDAVTAAKIAAGAVGTGEIAGLAVDLSKLASGSVDATKIVDGSITPAKITFTAADIGSIATYYQTAAPTGTIATGSLWADSDDGNKLYRWTGSSWLAVNDAAIAAALAAAQAAQTDASSALTDAAGAQATADGKVTVFFQGTAPSGAALGDLWINTGSNNTLQRWSGTAWVAVPDTRIASALANAATAQSTADGKITAYYQGTAPTTHSVGDLWYDTSNGNLASRWNGTAWVGLPVGSGAISAGAVGTTQIAGAAVDITKLASGSVGATQIVTDAVTAAAIASGAVGSGELATGSVIAGKVAAGVIGATEIAANAIVAGKINAAAVTAGTVAAGVIGTNELAANSVVAGKIAADSVTSTEIVAGTIQTSDLAADSVAAGKIAADAITARELQALSVVAGKIDTNAVTAGTIAAGAITADKLAALLVLASQVIAGDPAGWHLELGDSDTPILYWDGVSTGFAVSRDPATDTANVYVKGRLEFGDGSMIENDYIDLLQQPSTGFQTPTPRQSRMWINSGPTSSVTAQWQSATRKGSLCVMAVWQSGTAGTTPNCGTPSGATIIDSRVVGLDRLTLFYVPNSPTSRTAEPFGSSAGAAKWAIALVEFDGVAVAPLDVQSFSSGTGTAASSGTTTTTTQAAELQIAVVGSGAIGYTNGKGGQWTAPTNGFMKILEADGTGGQGLAFATRTTSGTGTATMGITANKSVAWIGQIATFKLAAASAVPDTPPTGVTRVYERPSGGKSSPWVVDDSGATYPLGRPPYCVVRLTGNNPGLTANVDVWAQGDWSALDDPFSLVSISTSGGTFSNVTIPLSGYYRVSYRAIFLRSVNTADDTAVFVAKNGRTVADSIVRMNKLYDHTGGDGTVVHAQDVVKLTAGDLLYWGNWSSSNSQFFKNSNTQTTPTSTVNNPTELNVFYYGPS